MIRGLDMKHYTFYSSLTRVRYDDERLAWMGMRDDLGGPEAWRNTGVIHY